MRTTLSIENDAVDILRAHAKRRGISLGHAASDLIRNGARCQLPTRQVNGLPVFDVPAGFPKVTDEMVRLLADED